MKIQPSRSCNKCGEIYFKHPHYDYGQWNRSKFCSRKCLVKSNPTLQGYWLGKKRPNLNLPQQWRKGDHIGIKHHNWKGGVTDQRNKDRNTLEQRQWRILVFERDNYSCVLCGKRGGNLIADHYPYPFYKYPLVRLDLDNGRTLCEKCNHIKTYKEKEWSYA